LIAAEILAKSADSIDQRRVLVKLTANGRGKVFEFVGFITEWLQRELVGSKRTD